MLVVPRRAHVFFKLLDGAMVGTLASHLCDPGSVPSLGVTWGVEFAGSLLCTERFFS